MSARAASASASASASLFRERHEHGHHRVTFVELFFDLVFVFAVTQLSHRLLEDFTPHGFLETTLLMFAVWWVWMYTSWITNWLDPERAAVRTMMFGLMLAGLFLSMSIPKAFEERGLAFAIAYAGMQVGRTLFMQMAIPRHDTTLRDNFRRILAWFVVASVLWVAGGLEEGGLRLALWGAALAVEYLGPAARYWTPGLGASSVTDWAIEGGHLAERCALFIIIALGEALLMTGATFAKLAWTPSCMLAFGAAFVGTLAMWWIYFDRAADVGVERITEARDPGRLGRLAYTYLHLPIVAGIVLGAVADELVIAHPDGHTGAKATIAILGGPLLYVVGVLSFKHAVRGVWQLSHLAGIVALGLLVLVAPQVTPLVLALAAAGILAIVAAWETMSLGKKKKTQPVV